jgi:hypothetical protein
MVRYEEGIEPAALERLRNRFRCVRLKFASGKAPGYRQAPVCVLTGRMNAPSLRCCFAMVLPLHWSGRDICFSYELGHVRSSFIRSTTS